MSKKQSLVCRVPVSFIKNSLKYDPPTGDFTWLDRPWLRPCVNARTRFKNAGTKSDGYIRVTITYQGVEVRFLGHRLAWLLMTGEWLVDEIDHKDHHGFNNSWDNIRPSSSGQNKHNTRGWKKRDLPKGVYLDKSRGTLFSSITSNGVTKYLGSFPTVGAAQTAYLNAAVQLNGEYANKGDWE